MTALAWDATGSRFFEAGVDRGVLYIPGGAAVPWNGLISIAENSPSAPAPVYYDGVMINNISQARTFSGTLTAFTYPEEFEQFEGLIEDSVGFIVADQPPGQFHLSYRTKVGNDVDGEDHGYRIHVLYNLTATPSTRTYRTLGFDTTPTELSWSISAVASEISGYRPASHLIIDTRRVPDFVVSDVEEVLYGSDERDPILPSFESFASFFRNWDRIVIIDNGDGTWTASTTTEGRIIESGGEFTIMDATATFLDADTYEISSTPKGDELWQQ